MLVLGGALAAGHRQRRQDAVILKTLGATRSRLLSAFSLEYGLLGIATALFAAAAGTAAAWYVVVRVMELEFSFEPCGRADGGCACAGGDARPWPCRNVANPLREARRAP